MVLDCSEGFGVGLCTLTPKGLWENQGTLRDKGIETGERGWDREKGRI